MKELKGQATQEEIDAWKKEHKNGVFGLKGAKGIGYFKNPDRHDLNAVLGKMSSERPLEMFEDLARTLWLGGDNDMLEEDAQFFGTVQKLKAKMDGDSLELVNL